MKCQNPYCGKEVDPNWVKCPYCGTPLRKYYSKPRNRSVLFKVLGEYTAILTFLMMNTASAFVFGAVFILLEIASRHFGDRLNLVILGLSVLEILILMVIIYPFSIALLTTSVSGLQTWLFHHNFSRRVALCFVKADAIGGFAGSLIGGISILIAYYLGDSMFRNSSINNILRENTEFLLVALRVFCVILTGIVGGVSSGFLQYRYFHNRTSKIFWVIWKPISWSIFFCIFCFPLLLGKLISIEIFSIIYFGFFPIVGFLSLTIIGSIPLLLIFSMLEPAR